MNKLFTLVIAWGFVIVAYILLAVLSPAIGELAAESSTEMQASANMTEQPGVQGAVESSGVWIWIIPGVCGVVYTVWVLKYQDRWANRG